MSIVNTSSEEIPFTIFMFIYFFTKLQKII
jgi:hypothetical protein